MFAEARLAKLAAIARKYEQNNRDYVYDMRAMRRLVGERFQSQPCPCGGTCSFANRKQHFKTRKHLAWLEAQEPEGELERGNIKIK